jgi:hypothetical protein
MERTFKIPEPNEDGTCKENQEQGASRHHRQNQKPTGGMMIWNAIVYGI